MLSVVSLIPDFLFSHWQVLLGYAIAVVFPVPWLSSGILSVWNRVGAGLLSKVTGLFTSSTTTTTTAATTTTNTDTTTKS